MGTAGRRPVDCGALAPVRILDAEISARCRAGQYTCAARDTAMAHWPYADVVSRMVGRRYRPYRGVRPRDIGESDATGFFRIERWKRTDPIVRNPYLAS